MAVHDGEEYAATLPVLLVQYVCGSSEAKL